MSIENMPSVDIVDLIVEQDAYQAQPQRETQPGVDPQDWGSIVESFKGNPATVDANGNVWRGREPQRKISTRAQEILDAYFRQQMGVRSTVINSEAQGWRTW